LRPHAPGARSPTRRRGCTSSSAPSFTTSAVVRRLLFARVDVLGVAWMRIAAAALVFALWRRPWRVLAALDRDGRRLLLAWGVVPAVMNVCFYRAISRLPLGDPRGDRVPAGDRARRRPGRARRATSSRWRSPSRASTC